MQLIQLINSLVIISVLSLTEIAIIAPHARADGTVCYWWAGDRSASMTDSSCTVTQTVVNLRLSEVRIRWHDGVVTTVQIQTDDSESLRYGGTALIDGNAGEWDEGGDGICFRAIRSGNTICIRG